MAQTIAVDIPVDSDSISDSLFENCDGRSGSGTENSVVPVHSTLAMLHIHPHLHFALKRKYKPPKAL
jgi:hypothetical protein